MCVCYNARNSRNAVWRCKRALKHVWTISLDTLQAYFAPLSVLWTPELNICLHLQLCFQLRLHMHLQVYNCKFVTCTCRFFSFMATGFHSVPPLPLASHSSLPTEVRERALDNEYCINSFNYGKLAIGGLNESGRFISNWASLPATVPIKQSMQRPFRHSTPRTRRMAMNLQSSSQHIIHHNAESKFASVC